MIRLYMDHNVHAGITRGLRTRGIDVVTAYEDDHHEVTDDVLPNRAHALERLLFSQDGDLLRVANLLQRSHVSFSGVVYAHQSIPIGKITNDLELIAKVADTEDIASDVIYLPF